MQNVFSYPLIVDELSSTEKCYAINATEAERSYVKEVLKVPNVKSLEAAVFAKYFKKEHRLDVWGSIKTTLTVQSVISLECFDTKHKVEFELKFDTKMTRDEQKELEEIQDNVPDIIYDGKIDLADIIIEQIALNMDDHPRKKGETFEFKPDFDPDEPICANPFQVLEKLKK